MPSKVLYAAIVATAVSLSLLILIQGCLPAMWVAAVGTDLTLSGNIEFQPFENSWVAPRETWQQHGAVQRIAVAPFSGDEAMAARFVAVLKQATALHVVSPSEVTNQPVQDVSLVMSETGSEQDQGRLAQQIAKNVGVDCVLLGRVVAEQPREGSWEWKQSDQKRLLLHLVDAEGTVVWKDELPFTVVKGAKEPYEEWVQKALRTHVMAHAEQIGLTEFWPTQEQISSPPS
ncbi:MAG TPA: hypothetical protein VJM82_08425 [Nitrospiraceae bacterium]|nr:hypothetical protein [Nitrospiraceae bacterium]